MPDSKSILGTGWSFPPAFSQNGAGVHMVSDEADIEQSLQIILNTRLNERTMQEDFGCELSDFLFAEIDQRLVNSIRRVVEDALLLYEPRIEVEEVDVSDDEALQGRLIISIIYRVVSTNTRFNMVFPFYINEAII